jgi:site-specific DNA-cytosine methylase
VRLLDLFCGAGGAAVGYHRAGFTEIVGVDINPQPDYPFEFVQADATDVAFDWDLSQFDLIHASPPCQAHSALTKGTNQGRVYLELIGETRGNLEVENDTPFVIENVAGAPIRKDVTLCGEMFGLSVIRHRYFELTGWTAGQPHHPKHRGRVSGYRHGQWFDGPYVAVYGDGGGKGSVAEWQAAMGIDWTDNRKSIAEAIPPAYTEYLGRQFIDQQVRA